MLLFYICHIKRISQITNDPQSHRFLSLSFTKNSFCQKVLIHWNQNAAALILVLLDFLKYSPSRPRMWIYSFKQGLLSPETQTFSTVVEHTLSSLSCLSGGLAQKNPKGWIFPGYRHSVLNSFSHLTETVPFQPVTEVTEWNLEGTLMKHAGAQWLGGVRTLQKGAE